MKTGINWIARTSIAGIATAIALPLSGFVASAYDSPTFDSKVFSADGIFWSESEKQSLLEALASLAVNFPSSRQVDSDLKEKALGLALLIDPLHFSARRAHESLVAGKEPDKTEYFDSLSAISEALWRTSSDLLSTPAEPEEIRLAPYLMEISLLIHPDPPADRMESFGLRTKGGSPGWNRFLDLNPEKNPSSRRAQALIIEANDLLRNSLRDGLIPGMKEDPDDPPSMGPDGIFPEPSRPGTTPLDPFRPEEPDRPKSPKSMDRPRGPDRPMRPETGTSFEPIQVSIPTIRTISSIDSKPAFGKMELQVRRPFSFFERSQFPFLDAVSPSEYPTLPLQSSPRGISLRNIQIPTSELEKRGLEWPGPVIGFLTFEPAVELPGPRRLSYASGWIPALVALQVALSEAELNTEFLLSGSVQEPGSPPKVQSEIDDFIEALPEEGTNYLLVPESALEEMVTYLQVEKNLKVLFDRVWVSYEDVSSAIKTLTSETDAKLLEAGESFNEIAKVSDRMSFVELARNEKVQERLEAILEIYPSHFSAKAMLEFGTRPVPENIQLQATAKQIEKLVIPYIELGSDPEAFNNLRGKVGDAKLTLTRMRQDLPRDLVGFHNESVDLLDQAEICLGLTNLSSSLAQQRLRELREKTAAWKSLRDTTFAIF